MPASLSPAEVTRFRQDGLLFPKRLLSREVAGAALHALEAAEARGGPIVTRRAFKLQLLYPFLHNLVRHPAILDAVESLLGPDLLVYSSGLFIKEPRSSGYVAWHQDQVHYGLEPAELVTAWVALSEVNTANGCMRLLPGSHRDKLWKHEDVYRDGNILSRGEEIRVEVDEARAVDVELAPGEVSLHHLLTVHTSPPNPSDTRRVGFAIRYIAPQVRQLGGRDGALLVRGEDRFGHWDLEQPPVSETDADTLARYEAAMDRRERIFFTGATPPEDRKGGNHAGLRA